MSPGVGRITCAAVERRHQRHYAGGSSAPGACRDDVRAAPALSLVTALASVPAGTAGPGGTVAAQAPNAGVGFQRPAYVASAPVRLSGRKVVRLRSGRSVLKALSRSSCRAGAELGLGEGSEGAEWAGVVQRGH